ncbi:hypothetical protein L3556_05945 [Candidatus Synechococcus calcipolaris G9]|uniref:Uncharacterized protein n=1 Tax=Candidatus Synechococcus calcipolaris G9 TaxID=1497997 RepID=A0ABT6EXG4_9SYNE|nr:hypothetical protein [Candidatus Synechococcus calcipolaris]MDG2990476.1 hypothetical protein [Candidatus Synechococcus calcipolaris G9]
MDGYNGNYGYEGSSSVAVRPLSQSGQMDDRDLLKEFVSNLVENKSRMLANRQLRVEILFDEVQLTCHKDGMIARMKTDTQPIALEVREISSYRGLLQDILIDFNIFLIGKASTKGFFRYEPRSIPDGYDLQYTEAGVLWKDRWNRGRRNKNRGQLTGVDAMFLHRGTWYPIQNVTAGNGFVVLRTLGDEATMSASDFIPWLKKKEEATVTDDSPSQVSQHKMGARLGNVASAPTQIITSPDEFNASDPQTLLQRSPEEEEDDDHSKPELSKLAAPMSPQSTPMPPLPPESDDLYEDQTIAYVDPNYGQKPGEPVSQGYHPPSQEHHPPVETAENYDDQTIAYVHPNYQQSQGYPQQPQQPQQNYADQYDDQTIAYAPPNYHPPQGYPQHPQQPQPYYQQPQGYPQQPQQPYYEDHSSGYPHTNYGQGQNYGAPPPLPRQYHVDPNVQMALTYLQSSLAYLLQVEQKSPNTHAAIRSTSMAIQSLLTILNA